MINRRSLLLAAIVAAPIVTASTLSTGTTFGFATPTTTTTSPTVPPVIVLPTTPPPPTPPTTPTTARPSTPATTTAQTVPPIVVQQSPPTTAAVDDLGPTPTTAALPVALPTTSTSSVPPTSEEDIVLGELSFDPAEWPADVVDFLQAEGVDVDQLPAGAAPHGQPGGLLSNEGCAVQCITEGVAYPVGTGAHVKVVTAVPATIRIGVFGADPANATSPTSATTWGHTWPDLDENTTYVALVKAEDAAGNESFASGEFTTLTRFAQVELYDFQAAAQLPYEHFHASVWIGDEFHGEFYADDVDPLVIDAGTAAASLDVVVRVTLHDHDNDCLVQAADGGPPDDGGGSDCNSIWGVATSVSELDIYPATATYWTEHTIDATLSTPLGLVEFDDAPPVPFVAQLRIDVTYEHP